MTTIFMGWLIGWIVLAGGILSTVGEDPTLAAGGMIAGAILIVGCEIAGVLQSKKG